MNTPTASGSAPYYFISYCRQEVTFVDSFSRELEKRGIRNWVDFRKLVPGQSWQPQLDDGVGNAAAILLVASKASMASAPCKDEWTKSLAAGKRIILIIFEPCKVDPGLAGLEWVDFTGSFDTAMNQLVKLLAQPAQKMTSAPPQDGIRLPGAAKTFYGLSILAALLAVLGGIIIFLAISDIVYQQIIPVLQGGNAPTENEFRNLIINGLLMSLILIWFPAIWGFVQIPWRVRNRTYNAGQLSGALNSLVFANLFLLLMPVSHSFTNAWAGLDMGRVFQVVICVSVPLMLLIFGVCFLLYRLLISDSMYRWAGPTGAIIRVTRPDLSKHLKNGELMKVAIESAPQDKLYAQAFKASLVKAGHIPTENLQEADIVLPLLSVYKNNSSCDPEKTRVVPVLLQRCGVDPRLSQVQWVDLRYGQVSIDAVTNLLDEPDKLLSTLGVLPVRTTILPEGVKRLTGALSVVLSISVVFTLMYMMEMGSSTLAFLLGLLIVSGTYFLRRYIIDRRSKYLPFLPYRWVLGSAVLLALLASFAKWDPIWLMLPLAWLVPLLMLSKEVRMWMPAK
ncbi:MAG TPA: toll/interleukin-1 receptor domain-containing protein [Anaerolineales bacterium]|nr:toll/interleukin-1 receptor domain-containing protein [Anaerolineales bacterium]